MTDEQIHDEGVLIDFLRGELAAEESRQVRDRLATDAAYRRLHDDIANALAAVSLLPEYQPPETLVENTLARVRQAMRTEAILAREEGRRAAYRPTFSFRELVGIAAAVIFMAVVFIPSVREGHRLAVIGRCASNVAQIGTGILAYANANEDLLPAPDGVVNRWLPNPAEDSVVSNSAALFKLVRHGYASAVVFRCPAGGEDSFQVHAGMNDFPAGKFIGYSYQHTLGPHGLRRSDSALLAGAVIERMAVLADSTPLFSGGRFCPEKINGAVSENHGCTGQNVLYLDGHVEWTDRPTVGVQDDNIFLVRGVVVYRGTERPSEPTDTFLLPAFSSPRQPARSP